MPFNAYAKKGAINCCNNGLLGSIDYVDDIDLPSARAKCCLFNCCTPQYLYRYLRK